MLVNLRISNIALIDKVDINFNSGLTVLTGETGAGKSIIIDAINFVLGERADKSLIRTGQNVAKVDAVFYLDDLSNISQIFNNLGLELDNTIILSRTMSIEGKNECRVNGQLVTVGMLKQVSNALIDIHGQQEHQIIMSAKNHLTILDLYAGSEIQQLKVELAHELNNLSQINNKIQQLGGNANDRQSRMDYLLFQIQQLENANIKLGEEEELSETLKVLNNTEKIKNALTECLMLLENNPINIINSLSDCERDLSNVTSLKKEYEQIQQRISSSRYELADCVDELKNQLDMLDFDQNQFDTIDARLDQIKSLKRKFNKTESELIDYLDELKSEYNNLCNSEQLLAEANNEKQKVLKVLESIANKITNKRKQVSLRFEQQILNHLYELGMPSARFSVEFKQQYGDFENIITYNGADDIEFMFSANLGQPLKPLIKVISGGEMSRFMLAFKNVISDTDSIPTLIFDEIDTGISGNIAHIVAKKMAYISKQHQVISISHLPQIAAMADNHFFIHKFEEDGKTKTEITKLDGSERINEISRLLGGISNSELSKKTAQELLTNNNHYKNQL